MYALALSALQCAWHHYQIHTLARLKVVCTAQQGFWHASQPTNIILTVLGLIREGACLCVHLQHAPEELLLLLKHNLDT